jgi:putative ATP-dependent endonuclease of the OLD family
MRLEEVVISNFCSCQSVRVPLTDFNPLIGYNNCGKSNILRAIAWLLRKSVLPAHIFWDSAVPVTVEGVITTVNLGLLPANQQAQVGPYLQGTSLRFRRRQDQPSIPVGQIKIDVFDPATGQWAVNPTGFDNAIGALFPEPLYIEAMEDAVEDVSRFAAKNTIGLLLKYAIEQVRRTNVAALASLEGALQQVGNLLNGPARIQELQALEVNATQAIASFFPGLGLHLDIQAPGVEDLIKSASVTLSDTAGVSRPFTSYGHGAQRSVHMALIKLLASYASAANGSTIVLLIDEPELYLHPQAIETLRESLKALSTQGFQIIFSTHSPLLVAREDALQATLVFKNAATGTGIRQRLLTAAQVLANNAHQASVVFSLQHSTYLLFSESVLVVEGKTERMMVPDMYELVRGHSLGFNKSCLVEVAGSSSILPTMEVLRAFGFSPKSVADLDFAFKIAPVAGLLNPALPELQTCMNWFSTNTGLGFVLGTDGFPARVDAVGNHSILRPSEAFELMAAAQPAEVAAIVGLLQPSGIWVWWRGAIEAHLGIAKNDTARTSFLSTARANQNVAHASDPGSITAFLNWF